MVAIKIYVRHFDAPLKYGAPIPERKQVDITLDGLRSLVDLLQGMGVNATVYLSVAMDNYEPDIRVGLERQGFDVIINNDSPKCNYWQSLHILPFSIFAPMAARKGEIVVQAWEFSDKVTYNNDLRLPFIMRRNAGEKMRKAFAMVIDNLKNR